ncbi:unnamed protein product [Peniophora sp. CBMAI 1063]|nr:unnamed protein product [Peniophora sp. CBMAI 1063]
MSSSAPPPSTSPSDNQYWAQAAEARLRALPQSISAHELLRERESSKTAHETFMAHLNARLWHSNGRLGGLPVETLGLIFSWLATMEPIGEIDVDALPITDSETDENIDMDSESGPEQEYTASEIGDESASESAWSHASSADSGDISLGNYTYTIGWVRVTWVCHLWREIALSKPSLWSYIPMHLPTPWINTLRERSKETLLTIDFTGEEEDDDAFLKTGTGNMSIYKNARSIIYNGNSGGRIGAALRLSGARALEYLESNNSVEAFPVNVLQPHLLGSLKTIEISLIDRLPSWSFECAFSHLTSLRLGILSYRTEGPTERPGPPRFEPAPNPHQFMIFIGSLTKLENLELHGCLPINSPTSDANIQTVTLPHLRSVALTGRSAGCALFLRNVVFPNSATLRIDCLDLSCDGYDELALDTLASRRATLHSLSISYMFRQPTGFGTHFRQPELTQALVYGSSFPESKMGPSSEAPSFPEHRTLGRRLANSSADFSLLITPHEYKVVKTWVQAFPKELCTRLSVHGVRYLALDVDSSMNVWHTVHRDGRHVSNDNAPVWEASQWTDLLRQLSNLHHLRVFSKPSLRVRECSAVVDLLQALVDSNELLPDLQQLDLVDLDPESGVAGAFATHVSDPEVDFAIKDPNSPNDASHFLKSLVEMRPTLAVHLIRRQCQDNKNRWMAREWLMSSESRGRVHFEDPNVPYS